MFQIRKGDGLPSTICCECKVTAEKAFILKKKSAEVFELLKGFYKEEKDVVFPDEDNISQVRLPADILSQLCVYFISIRQFNLLYFNDIADIH